MSTPLMRGDTAPNVSWRIGIVIQGPVQTDLKGRSTREVIEALSASPLRERLFIVYAMWADEPAALRETIAPLVDRVVLCDKPVRSGSCHRNYQAHAVQQGLRELERNGITWALKSRSDLLLSERFLRLLLARAETPDYHRILTTNVFTRFEPFHVSDMVIFSTVENLRDWFNTATVYYEDLFSPEVQFARLFVRARRLPYPMTMTGYLQFLRDWIDLVDFYDEGLFWFKDGGTSIRAYNRHHFILYDRDIGPVLARLISVGFYRRLQTSRRLNLIAANLMAADAIQRYIFTALPGFRRRHSVYTVDNRSREHDKPVPVAESTLALATVPDLVERNGHYAVIATSGENAQEAST